MTTSDPRVEARPSDDGWCVQVTWPSGRVDVIPGFLTQYQALDWIKMKSANWIADKIMNDPGTN